MAHILTLPTELLQSLALHNLDLTILRLVCKTFDNLFLDAYTNEYLSELQCFVLDEHRLQRIKSILSQTHLAKKVQRIVLSLDPLEGKTSTDVPVALPLHFQDQFEIGQVLTRMSMLELTLEPYMRQQPPLGTISTLLQSLQQIGHPRVILDGNLQTLGLSTRIRELIETSVPEIMLGILQLLCLSSCQLSEIRLGNTLFLDRFVQRPGHDQSLRLYSKSLRSIDYEADLEDLNRKRALPSESEWGLLTLLQGASNLSHLSFTGPFDPRRVRSGPSMKFSGFLLTPNPSWKLQKVILSTIQCSSKHLLSALAQWRETLNTLSIDTFSMEIERHAPRGESWLEMFRVLLRCEQLKRLYLKTLYERSEMGDGGPSLDLREPGGEVAEGLDLHGHDLIQQVLRLNTDFGATFSYKLFGSVMKSYHV